MIIELLQIANVSSLNVHQLTNCGETDLCLNHTEIPIREVSSIDMEFTCYRLPFDQYDLRNPKEKFMVTADSRSLPNKMFADAERDMQVYFLESNTIVSYKQFLHNEKSIDTNFQWSLIVNVAVSAVHRSLRSLNRCSEFKTLETCFSECRVELLRQMCNCTPTSWSSWAKLKPYEECKLRDYVNCVSYYGNEDIPCVKANCSSNMELCERSSYLLTNHDNLCCSCYRGCW